jgi:hypothetical protein
MKHTKQLFFALLCITQIYAPAHASTCSTDRKGGTPSRRTYIHDVSAHNVTRCDDINLQERAQMSFEITNDMQEKVYVRINSTTHARAVILNPGQTAVVHESTNYIPQGMTGLVLGSDKSKNSDLIGVTSIGKERRTRWIVTNGQIKKR